MEDMDVDHMALIGGERKSRLWRWVFLGFFCFVVFLLILFFALYIAERHHKGHIVSAGTDAESINGINTNYSSAIVSTNGTSDSSLTSTSTSTQIYSGFCGGMRNPIIIEVPVTGEVTFNSPNHPSDYPANLNCIYHIITQPEYRIKIDATSFHLESNCLFDSVQFSDLDSNVTIASPFCGVEGPRNLLSTSNRLKVTFNTDGSGQYDGFRISLQAINSSITSSSTALLPCGGVINVPITGKAILQSPNYPSEYPPNVDCVYYITANPGYQININANYFRLESSPIGCTYDNLRFFEQDSGVPIGSPFCGLMGPRNLISSTNRVRVVFHTDSSNQYDGFHISVQATSIFATTTSATSASEFCGGSRSTGVVYLPLMGKTFFQSPNFPLSYLPHTHCAYHIIAPPGYRIKIDAKSFALESSSDCRFDSLRFYELSDYNSAGATIGTGYCGDNGPRNLQSATNKIKVLFRADGSAQLTGFNISVQVANPTAIGDFTSSSVFCGGSRASGFITVPANGTVSFQSPNFPSTYPKDVDCVYLVTAPPGHRIEFNSTDFHLELSCKHDSLSFYDFNNNSQIAIESPFCGSNGPNRLQSTTNEVMIVFQTDDSVEWTGFNITAKATPLMPSSAIKATCNSIIRVPMTGEVTFVSPNFPSPYPPNIDCYFKVIGPTGYTLTFNTNDFLLESSEVCQYDYLAFYNVNGIYETRSRFGPKYCGMMGPQNIQSDGNVVSINFRTDSSAQRSGFSISVRATPQRSGLPYSSIPADLF